MIEPLPDPRAERRAVALLRVLAFAAIAAGGAIACADRAAERIAALLALSGAEALVRLVGRLFAS